MERHNEYALLGLKALKRAAAKAAESARKNGVKIPVWKNDRIVFETPEESDEPCAATDAQKDARR